MLSPRGSRAHAEPRWRAWRRICLCPILAAMAGWSTYYGQRHARPEQAARRRRPSATWSGRSRKRQATETRVELLIELGEAQLRAGRVGAAERLEEALELATDSRQQARILLTLGRALFSTGEYLRAREVLRHGLDQLPSGDDLSLELSGWSIAFARDDPGLPAVTQRRLKSLLEGEADGTHAE